MKAKLRAVSACFLAALAACADVGTVVLSTAGTYTFAPASGNLIAGLSPSASSGVGSGQSGTGPVSKLTDGAVDAVTANTCVVVDNGTVTYTLGDAEDGYDITAVNIYSGWGDNGRSTITLTSLAYASVANPTVFTAIPGTAINYGGGGAINFAGLDDTPDGAFLTLQRAADAAGYGDTIRVQSGTYAQSVVFSQSAVSVRANGGTVTIDGGGTRPYGVKLQSVGSVTLDGFEIRNAADGVVLSGAYANLLTNLTIASNSRYGVGATNSPGNVIAASGILGNGNHGIWLSWMDGAMDPYGKPRVIGAAVEIGTYEHTPPLPGTVIIVH